MSGLLAGKVWQSGLHPDLKPLAAALADIGNDDGTSIYPSVAYVCWLLGRSERSVQGGLGRLKALHVLEVVRNATGGRGKSTEYRLMEENLPNRERWRNPALTAPFLKTNPAAYDTNPAAYDKKGCSLRQERVHPSAPEPSLTVNKSNRPKPKEAFVVPEWVPSDAWAGYEEMRRKVGKPMTDRARHLAVDKLASLLREGHSPTAVLEQSIFNGWQGLFPIREATNGRRNSDDPNERVRQAVQNIYHGTGLVK